MKLEKLKGLIIWNGGTTKQRNAANQKEPFQEEDNWEHGVKYARMGLNQLGTSCFNAPLYDLLGIGSGADERHHFCGGYSHDPKTWTYSCSALRHLSPFMLQASLEKKKWFCTPKGSNDNEAISQLMQQWSASYIWSHRLPAETRTTAAVWCSIFMTIMNQGNGASQCS